MWQFVGDMNTPSDWISANVGGLQGPLPIKRWVPDGKRYKRNYKPRTRLADGPKGDLLTAKEYTAAKAVQYAAWLAERDGVAIPEDARGFPVWGAVIVPHKKTPEPRVKAVEWRAFEAKQSFYSARRTYKPDTGKLLVTIAIPHWDFVPDEPVEILLDS